MKNPRVAPAVARLLSAVPSFALRELADLPLADIRATLAAAAVDAVKREEEEAKRTEDARAQFRTAAALGHALELLDDGDEKAAKESRQRARKLLKDYGTIPEDKDDAEALREALREVIQNDPLEIRPATDGDEKTALIVLCTGGPHAEFRVSLNRYGEATQVEEVIFKDWGTREDVSHLVDCPGLLAYAGALYLGE